MKKKQYNLYETNSWQPSYTGFNQQYYCHISMEEFTNKTKIYLNRLFSEMAKDGDFLLFDQLFPSNVNQEYLKYFDFAKVIIVDRDPRDLYFMNKVFWGSGYIPSENVNTYIKWFKETRENTYQNENILKISFEDMIFNTIDTQKKLCNFIDIDIKKHDKPRTLLFIEKSITNTQVYERINVYDKKYLEILKSDMKLICEELHEYLYPFPKLNIKDSINKEQKIIIEKVYKEAECRNIIDYLIIFEIVLQKIFKRIKGFFKKR